MSTFAGTRPLLRLFLRRDRIRIPVWIVALVGLATVSAASIIDLYSTPQQLQEFAALAENNPAVVALNGRPVGLATIGGRVAFEVLVFFAAVTALMSLMLVGRHTRAEEESGRTELLRGTGIVGSRAQPAAALLLVSATDLVVGAAIVLGLVALDLPTHGSIVLGAGIAMVGIVFAAVAALTAQVSERSRGSGGLAGAVLGAAYAVRAAGDVGSGTLSWLSPIGWAQSAEPYARDRWWPILLGLLVAVVLTAVAFGLVGLRDVGSGLVASRPGPPRGSRLLGSPVGLAFRLQRSTTAGWASGAVFLGLLYGTIGLEIDELLESTPELADYFASAGDGGTLTESYFATVAMMLGLVTAGYVVQGVLRLRTEEADGRAELVLGTPLSRPRWAGSHLLVVVAGSVLTLGLAGGATGLVHGLRAGDVSWVPRLAVAALVQLPAVWLVAGIALLLYGLSARLAVLSWAALAGVVVVALLADALRLPEWVRDLSPFAHLPQVPAADLTAGAPTVLIVLAAGLVTGGLVALRQRDVMTV